jgi:hypothetical protein
MSRAYVEGTGTLTPHGGNWIKSNMVLRPKQGSKRAVPILLMPILLMLPSEGFTYVE